MIRLAALALLLVSSCYAQDAVAVEVLDPATSLERESGGWKRPEHPHNYVKDGLFDFEAQLPIEIRPMSLNPNLPPTPQTEMKASEIVPDSLIETSVDVHHPDPVLQPGAIDPTHNGYQTADRIGRDPHGFEHIASRVKKEEKTEEYKETLDTIEETSVDGEKKTVLVAPPTVNVNSLAYRPPPPPVRRHIDMPPRCSYDPEKWALHPESALSKATMFERHTGGSCEECLKECASRQSGPWTCRSVTYDSTWHICDLFAVKGNSAPYYLVDYQGRDYFEYMGASSMSASDLSAVSEFQAAAVIHKDDEAIASCQALFTRHNISIASFEKKKDEVAFGVKTLEGEKTIVSNATEYEAVRITDTDLAQFGDLRGPKVDAAKSELQKIQKEKEDIGRLLEEQTAAVMAEQEALQEELKKMEEKEKEEKEKKEKEEKEKKETEKEEKEKEEKTEERESSEESEEGSEEATTTQKPRPTRRPHKIIDMSSEENSSRMGRHLRTTMTTKAATAAATPTTTATEATSTTTEADILSADTSKGGEDEKSGEAAEDLRMSLLEEREARRQQGNKELETVLSKVVRSSAESVSLIDKATGGKKKAHRHNGGAIVRELPEGGDKNFNGKAHRDTVCVKGEAAVFLRFENTDRPGALGETKRVSAASADECRRICDNDAEFECSSAVFSSDGCLISTTRASHKRALQLQPLNNTTYLEKLCVPQGTVRDNARIYPAVADRVLIGHVQEVEDADSLSECLQACLLSRQRHGFACRSAMWYPMDHEQNCLLNGDSRHHHPASVFVEEESRLAVIYFEMLEHFAELPAGEKGLEGEFRRKDSPIDHAIERNRWTFWSSCEGKKPEQMRYRYQKCSESKADIRKCPKESAFCGPKTQKPLVHKLEDLEKGAKKEETKEDNKCHVVRDSTGKRRCPHGVRKVNGKLETCSDPVEC